MNPILYYVFEMCKLPIFALSFQYKKEVFMMIEYDFHLHSSFSGDCDVSPARMAEQAASLGLSGICFTDHQDIDAPDNGIEFLIDFDSYFRELKELKEMYAGRLDICIGMEFGIQSHLSTALSALLKTYPFDFVIASQHFVDGRDPYYPEYFEGRSERDCYEEFFRTELETLRNFTGYQTLGHMDFVVRYGPNRNRYYSYREYADLIDPILRHLIENGKCLEVNTGGFKYGLGEPNPCQSVLRRYRELGGELITIGSDAHAPKHLAYDFVRAAALLESLGFRYYTIFKQAIPQQLPVGR